MSSLCTQPPKELFIEVRAMRDCGELLTYYGLLKLDRGSTHFVRRYWMHYMLLFFYFVIVLFGRSDVEHLIRQGSLVQVTAETGV